MNFLRFLAEGEAAAEKGRGAASKDLWHAYLLWFGAGWAGAHRFYLERRISGAAILLLMIFGVIVGARSGDLFWLKAGLFWWAFDGLFIPFLKGPPQLFPILAEMVQERLGAPKPKRKAQARRNPAARPQRRALEEERPAARRASASRPQGAEHPRRETRPPLRERLGMLERE